MADLDIRIADGAADEKPDLNIVYQEICNSYREIEAFRGRLLGFLPLASGTGIFLLLNSDLVNSSREAFPAILLSIGLLGSLVTLGLFSYEVRGLQYCHRLIDAAEDIEHERKVIGSFRSWPSRRKLELTRPHIGIRLASSVIYSAVLSAWVFVASSGVLLVAGNPETYPGSWDLIAPLIVFCVFFISLIVFIRVLSRRIDSKEWIHKEKEGDQT